MKRLIVIIIAALGLVSCHSIVFENRTDCPRFVFFKVTNPQFFHQYDSMYVTVYRHPDGSQVSAGKPLLRDVQNNDYFVEVRRTNAVKGYGLIGWKDLVRTESEWHIPLGMQADTLYRFSYQAALEEDSILIPVEFTKEHSKVTVQFVGIETFEDAEGRFPFDLLVRSGTNGIDALTGVPTRGEFEYRPKESETGRFYFVLPRQADAGLTLELYGRPFLHNAEGHIKTFDLYRILKEYGGMDWNQRNLPDLFIEIDYQQTSVTVSIDAWDESALHYDF